MLENNDKCYFGDIYLTSGVVMVVDRAIVLICPADVVLNHQIL